MTEQQLPEGAIPTSEDAPTPDGAPGTPGEPTMIGADAEVRIAAADVQSTVEKMIADGEFGEEEPLPVGANDPEVLAEQPERIDPPGMPHQPDDLDREMCARAQVLRDRLDAMWAVPHAAVRPDSATLHDARDERILDLRSRSVREALLRHMQEQVAEQREALIAYADALRIVQEARDEYVAARDRADGAEEALFAMDLATEADAPRETPEAPSTPVIDDSQIV